MRSASLVGVVVASIVAFTACSSTNRAVDEERAHSRKSLAGTLLIDDVVPMPGGGAYATGSPYGVWYVQKTVATRVRAVGDSMTQERFATSALLEVQPTTDGGAYAFSVTSGLWRLDGDSAIPVTLSRGRAVVADAPAARDNALGWTLYAREHRKGRTAEIEPTKRTTNP